MSNINKSLDSLLVPISTLDFDDNNARIHDDRNMKAIKESYEKFGQQKPIVIDDNNKVIAGNGQLQAAIDLGWDNIAAIKYSGDEETATQFAIADNRTAELAVWDFGVVQNILEGFDNDVIASLQMDEFKMEDLPEFFSESVMPDAVEKNKQESAGVTERSDGVEVKEIVTLTLSAPAYRHWIMNVLPGIEDLDQWVLGL